MANLIIHRPNSHCNPAEIRVAEVLRELDDRWTVIWGYFYKDSKGHSREGDFLIIGPAGGMLVLEVKSSLLVQSISGLYCREERQPKAGTSAIVAIRAWPPISRLTSAF